MTCLETEEYVTGKGHAKTELNRIEGEMFRLDQAGRKALGREWSDLGRMYLRESANDLCLEAREGKARAIKGGPLSEEELATWKKKADAYDASRKIWKRQPPEKEKAEESDAFEDVKKEVTKPQTPADKYAQGMVDKVKKSQATKAESALERLRAKAGGRAKFSVEGEAPEKPFSMVMDKETIGDFSEVGAAKIFDTGEDFEKWSEAMKSQFESTFGDTLDPHLEEIFKQAKGINEKALKKLLPRSAREAAKTKGTTKTDSSARAKAKLKADAVIKAPMDPKALANLVRSYIREGKTGEDEVFAALHRGRAGRLSRCHREGRAPGTREIRLQGRRTNP